MPNKHCEGIKKYMSFRTCFGICQKDAETSSARQKKQALQKIILRRKNRNIENLKIVGANDSTLLAMGLIKL